VTVDLRKREFTTKALSSAGFGRGKKRKPPIVPVKIIASDKFIGPIRTVWDISNQYHHPRMSTYNPQRSTYVLMRLQERFGSKVVNFKRGKNR
jgi:hypothetical protein